MHAKKKRTASRRFAQRTLAYALSGALAMNALAQNVTPSTVSVADILTSPEISSSDARGTGIDGATVHIHPSHEGVRASLDLEVFTAPDDAGVLYLNIFVDLDKDDRLDSSEIPGFQEWPVRNLPVQLAADTTTTLRSLPFHLAADPSDVAGAPSWLRVALGYGPLATASDVHAADVLVVDLDFDWPSSAGEPLPLVAMHCPEQVDLAGYAAVDFVCEWHALTPGTSHATYRLDETSGGVQVNDAFGFEERIGLDPRGDGLPAAAAIFTASRGHSLPAQWRYRTSGAGATYPTLRADATPIGGPPVTVVVHPSSGAIDFIDSVTRETARSAAAGPAAFAAGAVSRVDGDGLAWSPADSEPTFAAPATAVPQDATLTLQDATLTATRAEDAEALGSCGCVEIVELSWENIVGWGLAGAAADAGALIAPWVDGVPFEPIPEPGEVLPGVLIDPIPGLGDGLPSSIFVPLPFDAAPVDVGGDSAPGTVSGLGDPFGGMLVDPIPGDGDGLAGGFTVPSQVGTTFDGAATTVAIAPSLVQPAATLTAGVPLLMMASGDAAEDGPGDDRQREVNEALERLGIKRFIYWTVEHEGQTIHVVRDPDDSESFVRIKDPRNFVVVEVDGQTVRTDIIDIRNPSEHLAPLTAEELVSAKRQIGGMPVTWDDYLTLNPGDIVLVSILYQMFGDGEMGERITTLRAQGKTPQDIFTDPELRNAVLLALALGMVDAAGGKYGKGAGKKVGEFCASTIRFFDRNGTVKEAYQKFLKWIKKEAIKESANLQKLRKATANLDLANDYKAKDLATRLQKIAKQNGDAVTFDEARKIADEMWVAKLKKDGMLLPDGTLKDGFLQDLIEEFRTLCAEQRYHESPDLLWQELAAMKLGVGPNYGNLPLSVRTMLNLAMSGIRG